MYIRQECLLSFEEILNLQPQTKLELVLSQIDLSDFEIAFKRSRFGPKGYDPTPMLYALIAAQLEQIRTVKALVQRLKQDPVFRYCCCFEVCGQVPSEATFSRFLTKISESEDLQKLFHKLVIRAKELNIIDGETVAIDSTKMDAFESPKPHSKLTDNGLTPNWGAKRDTNGNQVKWFGWKLHILSDTKSELPLEISVTPANVYDGTVALPLIEKLFESFGDLFKPRYYAMDSGYDFNYIYDAIVNDYQAKPVIAYNPRGSKSAPEGLDNDLQPICSAGYKMVYWGTDGDYIKLRCPHVCGKVDCVHGSNWCSNSNYGYVRKVNYKKEPRFYSYPFRGTEKWQSIYNQRTAVERCNSRLKEYLNLGNIRAKGIKKALTHCLLNSIALVAGTIAANSGQSKLKVA
ncbi:transposase [Metallumcola ferriviriculae]|uniref:Transposase n=1 Tax=Metallumcola ferriviriculae TaxID=3039180 RepID=A0AAU0UMG0_9FIRM|nr:transposase [Desulfitibacteraceae bacterium MK1]WRO21382.1 transposase [Desulfitibacteraceae bacterium MK1]WRO23484.1 transposase [Desulfitibacteraceae bacterium MK1]